MTDKHYKYYDPNYKYDNPDVRYEERISPHRERFSPKTEPWFKHGYYPSNPKIGVCPVCGINLYEQMLYACQRFPCPTGLGHDISL